MNARPADRWDFDVLVSGTVFLDIVFTDLPRPPSPGTEVWTGGMGSSPVIQPPPGGAIIASVM